MRTTTIPPATVPVVFTTVKPQPPDNTIETFERDVYDPGMTTLIEDYTPNNYNHKSGWKAFQHYKCTSSPSGAGAECVLDEPGIFPDNHSVGTLPGQSAGYISNTPSGSIEPFGSAGQLDAGLPSFYVPGAYGFIPAPANLEDLTKRALASILPIIKAEVSLPNFIYELKDFKRPIAKIGSVFRSTSFTAALAKLGLTRKGLTFRNLLTGAAGHYLNIMFNVRPLITDIGKIHSALSRTERRINDFVTRNGKPQNRHWVWKWEEYINPPEESYTGLGVPSWQSSFYRTQCYPIRRNVLYDPSVYHAQAQFNYNYTGYQVAHAQLLGHLDALGININPAVIWNAIPWTFVVDWVLGVSKYLDDQKTENMRPVINIRNFLWSIKRSRLIQVSKGTRVVGGSQLTQGYMSSVRQTAYRRSVEMPDMSSLTTSGLTAQEVSLGAALVIVQGRRRKHH